jgi:hypothetical protein
MNFNLSQRPEYSLQASMLDELINLYGLLVKFLVVQKINRDVEVFGDYSHIKTDNNKAFDIYALPETSESMDNMNYAFTQFGYASTASVALFISKKTMEKIYPDIYTSKGLNDIIGNLIILPSGGIVEITDCQYEVPGVSNLFANIDNKNVYKLTCITYNQKVQNEIDPITASESNFVTLENYFDELVQGNTEIEAAASIQVIEGSDKVIVPSVDSVFGRF